MDKYEFNIKVEQIKKMVNKSDYETAMKIADTIDWKRVRNANLLSMIAQVYEKNDEYQVAKDILLLAFERAPIGKRLLYKLTELAIKEGNIPEAEAYYREFCDLAPDDPRQHLLRYLILKAKGAPSEQLVHSLERYTDIELEEKWLYELAELYCQAGNKQDCIKMCDRITLMFGLGKYVDKAMELKQKYAPLTPYQMSLVENRDKYESNLRNVERQFEQTAYTQNNDEFDEPSVMPAMDDELVAHLHQAEAEESLAKEMSRISIGDYIEDSPMGATRVIPEIKNIRGFTPMGNPGMPPYTPNGQYSGSGAYQMGNQPPYGGYYQGNAAAYNNQPISNNPYTDPQYGHNLQNGMPVQTGYETQANYEQNPYRKPVLDAANPGYNGSDANTGYGYRSPGYTGMQPQFGQTDGSGAYRYGDVNGINPDIGYPDSGTPQTFNPLAGYPNPNYTESQPEAGFSSQPGQGNPQCPFNQVHSYEGGRPGNDASQPYMNGQGENTEENTQFAYDEDSSVSETYPKPSDDTESGSGYVINTQAGFANHYVVKEQAAADYAPADDFKDQQITIEELQNNVSGQDYQIHNDSAAQEVNQETNAADSVSLHDRSNIVGINQEKSVETFHMEQKPLSHDQKVSASQENLSSISQPDTGNIPAGIQAEQISPEMAAGAIKASEAMETVSSMDDGQSMIINSEPGFKKENLLSNQANTYNIQDTNGTEHVNILEMQQDLRTRLSPDSMIQQPGMQNLVQEDMHTSKQFAARPDNESSPSDYLQRQYNAGKTIEAASPNENHPAVPVKPKFTDQDSYSDNQIPNHIMIEARTPEKGFEMAVEVLKQIHRELGTKNQVVKISGGKLSHKGIFAVASKLSGKDLIIEEAGDLTPQALDELNQMMEADTTGMIVVLIDNPKQLEELHRNYPILARRFECIGSGEEAVDEVERAIAKQIDVQESIAKEVIPRQTPPPQVQERPVERNTASAMAAFREERQQSKAMVRPVATGQSESYMQQVKHIQIKDAADDTEELELEEFAQYACRYASEIDCSITGKSKLALYERIEIMEEDGIPLTRANAEALIEEAADKAEKPSLGKLITGVFSSKYDKEGLLILKEHHFID